MNSAKKVKRIIAVLVTVVLFLCGLFQLEEITKLKSASARDLDYASYFEAPEDYDVLFFGSSHVMYGISPMDLWEDFGITSYNLASPTCTLPATYWKLKGVLEYAKPKLVVIDCLRASWADKSYSVERMHEALDAFPLSVTKYKAVSDLMDDKEKYSKNDKYDVLFKISAYHSRWDSLSEADFLRDFTDTKGGEYLFSIEKLVDDEIAYTPEITPDMEGFNYLAKIVTLCKEEGIPVVLTYMTYPNGKMEAELVNTIADEFGVEYLNFNELNIVDGNIDFNDSSSSYAHLNVSGNKKLTNYMGMYISQNYDVEDRRADDTVSMQWNDDYDEYIDFKLDNLCKTKKLDKYLMQLYGLPVDAKINISDEKLINNPYINKLLSNAGLRFDTNRDVEGDSNVQIKIYKEDELIDSVEYTCVVDMNDMSIETISADR